MQSPYTPTGSYRTAVNTPRVTVSSIRLQVNIDHVATLRQARRTAYPDILAAAEECRAGGAHGITVHLREDRRHIQDADVFSLREWGKLPLNLEMADNPEIVDIALEVLPDEVCLVPERRQELTTEGGLDVRSAGASLKHTVRRLLQKSVRVSLFIDPDPAQIEAAAGTGAPCIELHTGRYCDAAGVAAEAELARLIDAARLAHSLGLQVNAGHGINYDNIAGVLRIPHLHTLNIGHSIVCRAVFVGLRAATREMLQAIAGRSPAAS